MSQLRNLSARQFLLLFINIFKVVSLESGTLQTVILFHFILFALHTLFSPVLCVQYI